jgi:hypothetical protein
MYEGNMQQNYYDYATFSTYLILLDLTSLLILDEQWKVI